MLPKNSHVEAPPTILVVDDDPTIVDLLTTFLVRRGFIGLSAYGGQQCLDRARQGIHIDAIVLDIIMPDIDGFAVCVALREMTSTRSVPIVFLTGHDDPKTRLAGAASRANAFLVKPIRGRDLLTCIRTQIAINRQTYGKKRC